MDDLRSRFASLDAVAVPDLRAEIERRAGGRAERHATSVVTPRIRLRAAPAAQRSLGLRFAGIPVVVLLALLLIVLVGSFGLAAGWWWDRSTVLLPPSSEPPLALVPTGDCPGAVRTNEGVNPPAFRGWGLGPGPGFLTSAQPGPITALWHEAGSPIPPPNVPNGAVSVVEIDAIARTACRLMTPIRAEEGVGALEGAAVPAAAWTPRGDAFAIFRGNVEFPNGCCAPGALLVGSPSGYSVPLDLEQDYGSVVWSNRGAWLAVNRWAEYHGLAQATNHTISLLPADGTASHDLRFDCAPCVLDPVAFSPDDTRIAVSHSRINATKTDADQLIGIADVSTGTGVVIDAGLTDLAPLGWADDRTIVAIEAGRRLLAIPVEAPSQFRVIAELPIDLAGEGVSGHAWSPDLSKVAILQIVWKNQAQGEVLGWDVSVVDVALGGIRHIAREGLTNSGFIWAPDNRTFAYTAEINPGGPDDRVILKVADAFEGEPVAIALGASPIAWRPVWR